MAKVVCTVCHHQGKPRRETRGSLVIEIVLWCLACFPGLIYTLWRQTTKKDVCGGCGAEALVPVNSPRGKEILGKG